VQRPARGGAASGRAAGQSEKACFFTMRKSMLFSPWANGAAPQEKACFFIWEEKACFFI
jgi:hypothetical protein